MPTMLPVRRPPPRAKSVPVAFLLGAFAVVCVAIVVSAVALSNVTTLPAAQPDGATSPDVIGFPP